MNINFNKYKDKYPILTEKDISILRDYFLSDGMRIKLGELEAKKVKFFYIFLILFSIFIPLLIFVYKFYFDFFTFFLSTLIALILIILIFFGKYSDVIKDDILPGLVKKINKSISYSKHDKFFRDSLISLINSGLIKSFDHATTEDGIKYILRDNKSGDNVELTGTEVLTIKEYDTRRNGKFEKNEKVNNHLYLMKVLFQNSKYKIQKPIKLLRDVNNSIFRKGLILLGIFIFSFFIFVITFLPLLVFFNSDSYLYYLFLFITYFLVYYFYSKYKSKKRVILDNKDFEKEFDIFSDNEEETKKVFTQLFMKKIVEYVNRVDSNRIYEFYFKDNFIYIKYDLSTFLNFFKGGYMSFSVFKSLSSNLDDFIKFYVEIKNIEMFVREVKQFYY